MASVSEMSALAGAFGSIIGYIGAEVAQSSIFERLLWPQRFNNHSSITNVLKTLLMPSMGGPLHKAALETLDGFRRKGLYGGMQQGHMLDTAFYSNTKLKYKLHNYEGIDHDNEVRNGLWVTVLQCIRSFQPASGATSGDEKSSHSVELGEKIVRRTWQRVQHLSVNRVNPEATSKEKAKIFSESKTGIESLVLIFASELSAVIAAVLVVFFERCFWFAGYMCLPLVLKILAVFCSVRREPIKDDTKKEALIPPSELVLAEVADYDHGFPLIQGPESIVRQFFRHYGHPVRGNYQDRCREITSMALVFAFVLIFPIGLLSVMWTSRSIQIIWLSYQMHTVVMMHVNRLMGYHGPGRLEDNIARHLAAGDTVYLKSGDITIEASLESDLVGSIAEGREKVRQLSASHLRMRSKCSSMCTLQS